MIWFLLASCTDSAVASNDTVSPTGATYAEINSTTIAPFLNETEDVSVLDSQKYPYRVCMALSTDLVRFGKEIECVSHNPKTPMKEGIMVIYKTNIVAHTFQVVTYHKTLYFQRGYTTGYHYYMLGRTENRMAMPSWEIDRVNRDNMCYSGVKQVINGYEMVAFHRDTGTNETMPLMQDDYSSRNSMRYVSTKGLYYKPISYWLYTSACTINCVVTVTKARSNSPYDFFVLSSGEVVEISPFYDGENSETFEENTAMFHIRYNYSMISEFGNANSPRKTIGKLAFLQRPESTITWEIHNKKDVTCQWKRWQTVSRAIRTEENATFHFVSRSLTATFTSPKTKQDYNDTKYACIKDEFQRELDSVYDNDYNDTHDKDGGVEMYVTPAGLIVFWQALQPKSLNDLNEFAKLNNYTLATNTTKPTRRKRSVDGGEEVNLDNLKMDINYAQLQFTYDTLRTYINGAMRTLLDAWCLDQRRTAEMLRELSKINPSNILSAIYNRPVSAKAAGDVIALSECINVNQTSVKILKDMRKFEGEKVVQCYSRPMVLFNFVNSSRLETGQLGENNEILLGTFRTEQCDYPNRKIFVTGNVGYEYRDYRFKNVTDLSTIDVVDTMIKLNISPLENTDFRVLELYSRGEIKAANVFNLEDIMREYNAQKQQLRSLSTKIYDDTPVYLAGLDDFMQGLGFAGKGLGLAVGAIGGAVASVVGGVMSFLKNPFTILLIILIAVAVLVVLYLVFTRQRDAALRPIDYFFPYASQNILQSSRVEVEADATVQNGRSLRRRVRRDVEKGGGVDDGGEDGEDKEVYSEEAALQMLRALKRLDETRRNAASGKETKTTRNILDRLKNRGYENLPVDASDGED